MAPEFIDSTPQAATDQYALAMVAYEWLAGTLPFGGSDERAVAYQHLHTSPPSLRHYDPGIPTAVDQVICAALAKRPEDRYASVSEFAEAFAHASTLPEDEDVTYDLVPEPPETLYKEGLRARGQGKLELAEQLLSTLQSRAPAYNADIVQRQLQQIRSERRPQLLKQYRAEADAANETGAWAQEIDALQRLLQLSPEKREAQQARTRIHLAQQHQQYDARYQQAEDMIREGNREGARLVLKDLWEADPYYGDPAGLARKAKKISAPQTYHQVQLQRQKEEERQERRDEAVDQRADRDEFREKAYGPQLHAQWLICCCWFLLVGGLGTTVGALTQSWLVALIACAIAGALGWFLGYRKALDPIPFTITSVVGVASTLALTLALARLNYTHPISVPYTVSISTGFFTSKDLTQYRLLFLKRQLNFGLICGAVTAASAIIAAMIVRPPWGKKERFDSSIYTLRAFRSAHKSPEPGHLTIAQLVWIVVGTWIAGAALAAMIAGIAVLNEWGFGWDVGANIMLLGFLLGSTLFSGLGVSLPTWWTALKK